MIVLVCLFVVEKEKCVSLGFLFDRRRTEHSLSLRHHVKIHFRQTWDVKNAQCDESISERKRKVERIRHLDREHASAPGNWDGMEKQGHFRSSASRIENQKQCVSEPDKEGRARVEDVECIERITHDLSQTPTDHHGSEEPRLARLRNVIRNDTGQKNTAEHLNESRRNGRSHKSEQRMEDFQDRCVLEDHERECH